MFAGFAVAAGVAIEIGPRVLKRQIDNEVIGGAIVILGVAVEVILTFIAAQKTGRIQEIANSDVSAANERAINAEKATAEANLERAKLESKFRIPRFEDADGLFWGTLLEYRGRRRVDIVVFDSHIEGVRLLAETLHSKFLSAMWDSREWLTEDVRTTDKLVCFCVEARDSESQALQHLTWPLQNALLKCGIQTALAGKPLEKPRLLRGFRSWDSDNVAALRVEVGLQSPIANPYE